MANLLRFPALLLPALVPSWRFFDRVTASPRLEYRWVGADGAQDVASEPSVQAWLPFRPRPAQRGGLAMLVSLFWNPQWNEDLFLVSLCERLA